MLTPNIDLRNKTVLITGAAGFVGVNLVMELLIIFGLSIDFRKKMKLFVKMFFLAFF